MAKCEIEQMLSQRELRRFKAEERINARWDRLWEKAEALVGELMREGRAVYYITTNPSKGMVKEMADRASLVAWAIRYGYAGR